MDVLKIKYWHGWCRAHCIRNWCWWSQSIIYPWRNLRWPSYGVYGRCACHCLYTVCAHTCRSIGRGAAAAAAATPFNEMKWNINFRLLHSRNKRQPTGEYLVNLMNKWCHQFNKRQSLHLCGPFIDRSFAVAFCSEQLFTNCVLAIFPVFIG